MNEPVAVTGGETIHGDVPPFILTSAVDQSVEWRKRYEALLKLLDNLPMAFKVLSNNSHYINDGDTAEDLVKKKQIKEWNMRRTALIQEAHDIGCL